MATVTQSLKSKTETSITINWSCSEIVDSISYSKDNGQRWTTQIVASQRNGTYTISGLNPDTSYPIKTRVRVKATGKTVDSSVLSVTTYDYPHCIESSDFTLGDEVTLKFYNPLSRAFKFYIIGNGKQIAAEYSCSSTIYKGVDNSNTSVPQLYATIPDSKIGVYKVKVDYNGHINTFEGGGTYVVNEKDCRPIFSDFGYEDTVKSVVDTTGNAQTLIQNLSELKVTILPSQKMKTVYSADPWKYVIETNGTSKTWTGHEDATATANFGKVTDTKLSISVTAYDSRGVSTRVAKDVTIYPYIDPSLTVKATRKNNFENETTLTVSGKYSPVAIGGVNKNTISNVKYRYKEAGVEEWGGWTTINTTVTTGKFTCTNVILDLDNTKAYEFEVQVTDTFSKFAGHGITTISASLDIGKPIFIVSTNKKTCYINGKEVAVVEDVPTLHKFTNIPDGTDLNTITTIGTFKSTSKAHSDTMTNTPSGISGGFRMIVSNWTGDENYNTLVRQELYYYNRTYIRCLQSDGVTWSAWQQLAFLETAYPKGSVYISSTNTNPASTLGIGTWTLIDKSFKAGQSGGTDSNFFSPNAENWCTNVNGFVYRGGNTVRVRQAVKVELAMNDTGMVLGSFNWDEIGVKTIGFSMLELLAHIDGANGGIIYNIAHDTGEVSQVDVLGLDTFPTDKTIYLEFTAVVGKDHMLDDFCDRFYWRRTN